MLLTIKWYDIQALWYVTPCPLTVTDVSKCRRPFTLLLLLLLLFTAIEFSLGGSSPYTNTDQTNKNKYT